MGLELNLLLLLLEMTTGDIGGGGSRRVNSSLYGPKGTSYGLRQWPFTLKVWLSFELRSSTAP